TRRAFLRAAGRSPDTRRERALRPRTRRSGKPPAPAHLGGGARGTSVPAPTASAHDRTRLGAHGGVARLAGLAGAAPPRSAALARRRARRRRRAAAHSACAPRARDRALTSRAAAGRPVSARRRR